MMKQIETFIKHWPRAALMMLLGAILGLIAWMFLPRSYTAVTRLSVGIDYNQTGSLETLEEDRILGVAEDILHSDTVMKTVYEESSWTDYTNFFNQTLTSRTNETWSLAITGSDPEEIGKLSLLWLDTAYRRLNEALDHAVRAEAYQNLLEGMTRCLQTTGNSVPTGSCPTNPEEISGAIDFYAEALRNEKALSAGLSPAIRLGPVNPDQLEIRPASRSAAVCTLLGLFCGLIGAFMIVWFPENRKNA